MRRKALDELNAWKNMPNRKPLLLEGARQVGKTYLLEKLFGGQSYDNVVKVDLQNAPTQLRGLFDGSIEPARIIRNLELLYDTKIQPERTLLFFDEIQDIPRALTALKYFRENAPECHLAAAGSLLGVFLQKQSAFPVGQVHSINLEPMDFEEFLWASGHEMIAESLKSDEHNHLFDELLQDLFKQYMIVGGMPEVVDNWTLNHSTEQMKVLQQNIINDYVKDFSKYSTEVQATRIRQVLMALPVQFARANGKFVYGLVRDGARAREYELAIEWLVNAGLVRRVYNIDAGGRIPLKSYVNQSAFKLYFVDIGLMRQLADIPPAAILDKLAIFDEFNGLFAEQFVLQQIYPYEAYYWTGTTTSEIEFIIQADASVIPIEVKSGENVKSKSLRAYREKYQPELALRFSLKDLEYNNGLLNIPLYYSFMFEKLLGSHIG